MHLAKNGIISVFVKNMHYPLLYEVYTNDKNTNMSDRNPVNVRMLKAK